MEKIKKLLVEFNERKIPSRIERDFDINLLQNNKIISFVGVRRSGKTSYLYQIMNYLIKNNIDRNNIIYINFEDDRLYPLNGNELDSILPSIQEIIEYNPDKTLHLFLDEIQNIPYWSKWLRRIHDNENNIKIYITGSSSKLLSKEIATELRGRTISKEVFPFSFTEILNYNNINVDKKTLEYSSKQKTILLKYLKNYLKYGGFPEVQNINENKSEVLREYFSAIFYKDLVERHNIKSIKMFEDYLRLLVQNTGNVCSLTNHEKTLKHLGHKVSKSTLSEYIQYAQEAYFLFQLPVFSFKIKNQLTYPKKIYGIDTGLFNTITFNIIEQQSILIENIVFLELRKQNYELFYYKTQNNLEVDFLVKENTNLKELIQVSASIKNEKTREREVNALKRGLEELNMEKGKIITLEEKETIHEKDKTIEILPLYEFLL